MRSETQPYSNVLQYRCIALRMQFFPKIWNDKMNFTRSSSPSHREGPGTEVEVQVHELASKSHITGSQLVSMFR